MNNDIRWKQRFSNYKKATSQLTEFIEKGDLNKFEVQGLIKCFEYTFEFQLIEDGHIWIDALEKRNLMSHTYNEEVAEEAVELIRKSYYPIIKKLYSKLEELQ